MLDNLLQHYFDQGTIPKLRQIDFDIMMPWDYHLYLFQFGDWGRFAIVESDFLFLTDIPKDIEEVFDVKVEGWCTLLEYRKQTGESLLPPDIFTDYTLDNRDDQERYSQVAYKHTSTHMRYALLKVNDNDSKE